MAQRKLSWRGWTEQGAVAIGYAVGFALFQQVTFSHWSVISGFRLLALLLTPFRYWFALAVGEAATLGYLAVTCGPTWGWLWAGLYDVPPISLAMPIVYACRKRMRGFLAGASVDVSVLLALTVVVSGIWTLANMATLAVTRMPPGYVFHWDEVAARWYVGNFLGILTVAPLLLFVRESWMASSSPGRWRRLIESRMTFEVAAVLLPALAFLIWLASGAAGEGARQAARMAMFLPVIFLAIRHGWHGAALGGTASSIAVVATMGPGNTLETHQSEVFVSFAITVMMLFGARISSLNARQQKERLEVQTAWAIAQRNVYLGEMQLQSLASTLEHARESVYSAFSMVTERMRTAGPMLDDRAVRKRIIAAQEQLYRFSDTLFPIHWREHGLLIALREGAMARAMSECGMAYWCEIRGAEELKRLPSAMSLTLYRMASEAIAMACGQDGTSEITLTIRATWRGGRRYGLMRLDRRCDAVRSEQVRRTDLIARLPFHGLGIDALRDRARAFAGRVTIDEMPYGDRLTMILREPETAIH